MDSKYMVRGTVIPNTEVEERKAGGIAPARGPLAGFGRTPTLEATREKRRSSK